MFSTPAASRAARTRGDGHRCLNADNRYHFWDAAFVGRLGPDFTDDCLRSHRAYHEGSADAVAVRKPADWAKKTFALSKDDAYGQLPATNARGSFRLTDDYVTNATNDVGIQLSKAGGRLATILNQALQTIKCHGEQGGDVCGTRRPSETRRPPQDGVIPSEPTIEHSVTFVHIIAHQIPTTLPPGFRGQTQSSS